MVSELVTRSRGGYECYPLYAERERMLARVKDDDKTAKDIISAVDVARSIRETNISRDQQVGTTVASADKEKVMVAWESHAAKNDAWGRNLAEALPPEVPILRPALSGGFRTQPSGTAIRALIKLPMSIAMASPVFKTLPPANRCRVVNSTRLT